MTGYGKGESAAGDKKITVEIRSLNSKQLDLSVKLPGIYRPLEYEIRNRAAKGMQRGKVDIYVSVENSGAVPAVNIDRELFGGYYSCLSELASGMRGDREGLNAAIMAAILRFPDVVSTDNDAIPESEQHALFGAVEEALAQINSFREQEGRTLMRDILGRIDTIEEYKKEILPFEKRRVEAVKERIRESIASLKIPVDDNRLEQEMIFYVEKLDITEEKVRLENHCRYFREVAGGEENAGRKLGFITQEMGREINTIGSKANDSDIQQTVVKMKDELEKIKEQVLNIL